MARSYSERRHNRKVKGMRRVREDRAEHGGRETLCECFSPETDRGRGAVFATFADHPKVCSNPGCCGNPRKRGEITNQEKRAPRVDDWV